MSLVFNICTRRPSARYSLSARRIFTRFTSTMLNNKRSYTAALEALESLQSNRAIHSMFSPAVISPSPGTVEASAGIAKDLNSAAIPEVLGWLSRAGLSQSDLAKLKCIHVAGTKGKGSVCAFLTSILCQYPDVAGKVGAYTSPHLVSVRERITIDGSPVSQEVFARYFWEVWDAMSLSARRDYAATLHKAASTQNASSEIDFDGPSTKPFYFRFLTILAFQIFLKEGVRSAVVECGIGGEYDSTNILPPEAVTASVVTQLGIDHVGMLGNTVEKIAWHKAGVFKPGKAAFTRKLTGTGETVMEVLRSRAQEKGARLMEVVDEEVERWGGIYNTGGGLEGQFQKYNQALAVTAAQEHLGILQSSARELEESSSSILPISEEARKGLSQARLRGRCETKDDNNIRWFIDGAHTADSLKEVARWFISKKSEMTNDEFILVFNQQDREAGKLVASLLSDIVAISGSTSKLPFRSIFATRNDISKAKGGGSDRNLSVQHEILDSVSRLDPGVATMAYDNIEQLIVDIRVVATNAESKGRRLGVLVTGSLHLVGSVLKSLEPDAPL